MAKKLKALFVDLDGVLVDLHRALARLWGENPDTYTYEDWAAIGEWGISIPKPNFWERVQAEGEQWWANLPKLPWTDELWQACQNAAETVVILTSPGPFPESAGGKWQWVKEQLHTENMLIGKPKDLCSQPGHGLIDDRNGYRARWEAKGGIFLPLQRPWNPDAMPIDKLLEHLKSNFNE